MLKAVAFDLDDTLYNQKEFEYPIYEIIAHEVSRFFKVDENNYYDILVNYYNQNINKRTFDKAIEKLMGNIPIEWEKFVKSVILPIYRSYRPEIKPFARMIDLVKCIKRNKLITALITNGNKYIQNNKIDCLNIRDLFDKIYISDCFNPPARKPDLRMFEKFLNDTNIKGSECIYIANEDKTDKECERIGFIYLSMSNNIP